VEVIYDEPRQSSSARSIAQVGSLINQAKAAAAQFRRLKWKIPMSTFRSGTSSYGSCDILCAAVAKRPTEQLLVLIGGGVGYAG
jgi:hypothetical protein